MWEWLLAVAAALLGVRDIVATDLDQEILGTAQGTCAHLTPRILEPTPI